MKALILAAGMGTRLRTYTKHLPKGMLPVHGKPLLQWQIEALRQAGIDEIHIVTGYKAETIQFEGVQFHHNPAYDSTNMLASLMSAESALIGELLVTYADLLYTPELIRKIIASTAEIAVAADKNWQPYWQLRYGSIEEDLERFELDQHGHIKALGMPCQNPAQMPLRYIGLVKFSPKTLELLLHLYKKREALKLPWPASGHSFYKGYMTDLLHELIQLGCVLQPLVTQNHWLEFDTDTDYELLFGHSEALRSLLPWPDFWADIKLFP